MAAKRSPILGYNHNVRYRGVVFHVQTEDSGLMNPHLFTHLFHEGVIVSTRKLVYDAGSNEESIKSLMQAQHKAVMKDLRRGAFDEKIDQYLAGTPGLEPRSGADPAQPMPRGSRASTEQSPPPDEVIAEAKAAMSIAGESPAGSMSEGSPIEIVDAGLSEPIELPVKGSTPPLPEDDAPTLMGSDAADVAAAVSAANTATAPTQSRTKTAERTSKSQVRQTPAAGTRTPPPPGAQNVRDSYPAIEISEDDNSGRIRGPRDTAVQPTEEFADGIPAQAPARPRPASHGAAALPPMKSPSRPSIQPPVVQTRAGAQSDEDLSAPVEIYNPPPPSVEPPPGERSERPGQYSVSRKDGAAPIREKTGRIAAVNPNAIPSGLGRPQKGSGAVPIVPQRESSAQVPSRPQSPSSQPRVPTPAQPPPSNRVPTPQANARVHVTAPIANRPVSTPGTPNPSSGVVMTRPAVIVGSPAKPPPTPPATTQRVRKAREDEGRGFGQGLISEKSLDEVILAYLSEDAEEK
ncbi:MAG TPA: hypothetical protein VMZ53_29685 [Kofleriaceae bacterium]|nr:hypothetical protein [Kofleriaceae bacterium]